MAVITSRYTLDAPGDEARRDIGELAELVGTVACQQAPSPRRQALPRSAIC
jgi:hypothetical protein